MRKLLVLVFTLASLFSFSQTRTTDKNIVNRAGDHLMLQLSSDHWTGVPDSISSHMGGLSRGANIYLMLDKPFKGNPKLSVGIGLGVGTSHMFFKKMMVEINSTTPTLPFRAVDSANNFKKYKLASAFLEIPLEFRYSSKPLTPNKSFKFAIGVKGGIMLNAHTKGKTLRNSAGTAINDFTQKINTKSYFNNSRLAATARIGYGVFSLFGAYNVTSLFKDGVAADMKLYQIGITVSGL